MANANSVPMQSLEDPNLQQDLAAIAQAQQEYEKMKEKLQQMVMLLQSCGNPLIAAQDIMMLTMDMQGQSVTVLAGVDNLASDLRSDITNIESDFNQIGSDITDGQNTPTEKTEADIAALYAQVDSIEQFLKSQQALGSNSPIDQGNITNMLGQIEALKGPFGGAWDNAVQAYPDVADWFANAWGGQPSPEIQTIENAAQTLDQSVSAFSTTTNTKEQVAGQTYTQEEGIVNDTMKTYMQLVTGFVNNQKSS